MSKIGLKEFIMEEKAMIEKARAEYLEEKDYKEFVKWPQGVTEFTLMPIIPRPHESFGTPKKVFRITVDEEYKDWSVNPRSPMYRELLDYLADAPCDLKINRLGEGLDTRYSLTK